MILYSKITDAPSEEPVTVTEAKLAHKIDGNTEDTQILSWIRTATNLCESDSGLSFCTQERTVKLDYFPCTIILPYGPVVSVDEFTYIDTDGVEQTLVEDTDFEVDYHSQIARIKPIDSWPTAKSKMNAVTIIYTAGYGAASDVPDVAKTAILQHVADLYENRQNESSVAMYSLNLTSHRLLDSIRVDWYAKY